MRTGECHPIAESVQTQCVPAYHLGVSSVWMVVWVLNDMADRMGVGSLERWEPKGVGGPRR